MSERGSAGGARQRTQRASAGRRQAAPALLREANGRG